MGIDGTEDVFHVLNALTESGRFGISTQFMRLGRNYSLCCWHTGTGMPIDIFMYHREGDRLVTGVQTDMGYLQRFAFTPFELQQVEFVGIPIHAPSDIDLNLRENFGDWTVPDPLYISHMESPSTVDPGGEIHMMVGRLMLLKAIIKDHPALGRRVVSLLRGLAHSPWALDPALLDSTAAHYGFEPVSDTSALTAPGAQVPADAEADMITA